MNSAQFMSVLAAAVLVATATELGKGADIKGADAVIAEVQGSAGKAPAAGEKPKGPIDLEIRAYQGKVGGMSQEEAATAWLALVDQSIKRPGDEQSNFGRGGVSQDVLGVLPGPNSWKAVADSLEKRPAGSGNTEVRELGWKLIGRVLVGDQAGERALIGEIGKALGRNSSRDYSAASNYDQLMAAYLSIYVDSKLQLEVFERSLGRTEQWSQVLVPNLIEIAGEARAKELAKKALMGRATLEFRSGPAVEALFKKMAMEQMDGLTMPHWELVTHTQDADLYLAMNKKFKVGAQSATMPGEGADLGNGPPMPPEQPSSDWRYKNARSIYVMSLVYAGKQEEAIKEIELAGEDVSRSLMAENIAESGHGEAVLAFLEALLTRHPEYAIWNQYIVLAARLGHTDQMLKKVKEAAGAQGDASDKAKRALCGALLAADEVEPAIDLIRTSLAKVKEAESEEAFEAGVQLAEIGVAIEKPELVKEGLSIAHAPAMSMLAGASRGIPSYRFRGYIRVLLKTRDYPQAEGVITAMLMAASRSQRGDGSEILVALATVYGEAGRNEDVIALLQKAPWWASADLSDVMAQRVDEEHPALGVLAAKALLAKGRKEEAEKILLALVAAEPKEDDAYELLLPLMGDKMPDFCDTLYARDAFEERPLIWKAESLRRMKKLEAAEKAARQAIAVDPSDGETPHGHRMKVYSVLSDILKDRGDANNADNYAQVVAAIRMAERADDLYQIGMLKRAIATYEQALKLFADAYCIQSRLAVKYAEMGMDLLAAEHYRRAYELMPDSFGRIESHCFGCEGAFRGAAARGIAEKVFRELAIKSPLKPQVHYLLGYLLEEDRPQEALECYQRAVKRDPDYFNAWAKIAALVDRLGREAKERDEAIRNLARLDPLNRHRGAELQRLTTVGDFWGIAAKAKGLAPEPPGNIFELTAASKAPKNGGRSWEQGGSTDSDSGDPHTYLKEQVMVEASLRLLN